MSVLLEKEIVEEKAELDRRFRGQGYSRERFIAEKELRRKRELASNIRYRCIQSSLLQQQDSSFAGIWKLRKQLLTDMETYDYYSTYGCYEPVFVLSEKLCTKSEKYQKLYSSAKRRKGTDFGRITWDFGHHAECDLDDGSIHGRRKGQTLSSQAIDQKKFPESG